MEEVLGARDRHDGRRRSRGTRPCDDRVMLDQLVAVALDHGPGDGRNRMLVEVEASHRWRDRVEPHRRPQARDLERDERPEREARQREPGAWPAAERVVARRERIVGFAAPVVEGAGTGADTPEVEAQRGEPALLERARGHVHDLVAHGAAEQRMRMAHDRDRAPVEALRHLDQRLDGTDRPRDRDGLRRRRAEHRRRHRRGPQPPPGRKSISSTSNTSVALGGITPPAPRAP